nr:hypothetical protein [Tanacetum cinerariifolium]
VTDPALDPTLVVTPPVQDTAPPVVASQTVVDPATLLSSSGAPVVPPPVVQAPTDATDDKFDPSADPLEGLTAVQDPNADPAQLLAGNLAAAGDQPVDKSTTEGGGDKAFSGLLADGLKDVKGATSDTRSLKQADIQLEPAELGRLDIRVNMAADQQTQVTFMSAHVGVREALESQMSRLRDSFAQQG